MDILLKNHPNIKPRTNQISVPLPKDENLPPEVLKTLQQLPPLNNLRMFANVPVCFNTLMTFIHEIFSQRKVDKRLREYMYVRISSVCGLLYELRHNILFSKHMGISDEEIAILTSDQEVTQLSSDGNLVCKAAEEITKNISLSDPTLQSLLDRFGVEDTCEIIMLVSWFNMLMRFVESTRVPYESNLDDMIKGASPLK